MSSPTPFPSFQVWQQGTWFPPAPYNLCEQTFHGAAMYGAPGGNTSYLIAKAPDTIMGYAKRYQGDENLPLNLFYQVSGRLPDIKQGRIGDLWNLIQAVRGEAGQGGKYEIKAYNGSDSSWVYYFNNARQP